MSYYFINEDKISIGFNGFNRQLGLTRKIKDSYIDLDKTKDNQEKFRLTLSGIIKGKYEQMGIIWEHKS